jgi:hypothetical protein
LSLSGTTSVFLSVLAFGTGSPVAFGTIQARRRR